MSASRSADQPPRRRIAVGRESLRLALAFGLGVAPAVLLGAITAVLS
ncbi:MAG: hypothetical protein SV966_09515 [Actinomycetota bacterium]|nr:hypothetical protein [Actinomycetota bacterium]